MDHTALAPSGPATFIWHSKRQQSRCISSDELVTFFFPYYSLLGPTIYQITSPTGG